MGTALLIEISSRRKKMTVHGLAVLVTFFRSRAYLLATYILCYFNDEYFMR